MSDNAGFCTFVSQINVDAHPLEDVYESIFQQYEKVVIQALATSFGLDFLVTDRHGGDVDTIHNVREIGVDLLMDYKNLKLNLIILWNVNLFMTIEGGFYQDCQANYLLIAELI